MYKLLKFHFVEMDMCRTVARGSTFIWFNVRLHVGGGAFGSVTSNKIFD